jgi:flagellar hook assembly protein FlgD
LEDRERGLSGAEQTPSRQPPRRNLHSVRLALTIVSSDARLESEHAVSLYDTQGRLVRDLIDRWMPAGTHAIEWDGTDVSGNAVASGAYDCRVSIDGAASNERMLRMR